MNTRKMLSWIAVMVIGVSVFGCEAFVRKFTRKKKKENLPQEELVLVPEEYKNTLTKEEQYHQYLLFWKSWQDELINALSQDASHKKKLRCIEESLKNLNNLRTLLNAETQKKLDAYLVQMRELMDSISQDNYGNQKVTQRLKAERLKRNILRDFSYNKVRYSII